jgi:hypothetical protein
MAPAQPASRTTAPTDQRADRIGTADALQDEASPCRANTGQQLDDTETGDAIAGIFCPAQARQNVFHMCAFQELEPPELYEWNAAQRQFNLQSRAVMARTEQNGLIFQCTADFPVLKDPLYDIACLFSFVRNSDEKGTFARCPLRPQILGEPVGGEAHYGIRGGQDGLG